MIRRRCATAAILAVPLAIAAARPEFTSTWLAPDAAGVSFAGKKVAALVMSSDQSLRVSGEEQLVRELAARGVHGVATYRMAPSEELTSADRARPWFERAAVEGVVALRPVSADKQVIYSPSVWTTTSYTTLWGYYGYGWSGVYSPGSSRTVGPCCRMLACGSRTNFLAPGTAWRLNAYVVGWTSIMRARMNGSSHAGCSQAPS